MPPKIKVTKEEIVATAVDLIRTNGAQAINARAIATSLNCSTQPIFSNFSNMDELKLCVLEKIDEICQKYIHIMAPKA